MSEGAMNFAKTYVDWIYDYGKSKLKLETKVYSYESEQSRNQHNNQPDPGRTEDPDERKMAEELDYISEQNKTLSTDKSKNKRIGSESESDKNVANHIIGSPFSSGQFGSGIGNQQDIGTSKDKDNSWYDQNE